GGSLCRRLFPVGFDRGMLFDFGVHASEMAVYPFIVREKMAWWSQRGVAHIKITEALLGHPGTTLIRPLCNARIPARTTGAGFIINSFNIGVIFCCAALANPVSDMPGQSVVTMMP